MKLFRFGAPEAEKPGVWLDDGERLDVSRFGEDYDEGFFASDGVRRLATWFQKERKACARISQAERLGPPIRRPSKIVCVGLNYRAHALETNAAIPSEPVLFMKASTAQCGPYDALILPRGSLKTDWEVELALVIAKTARYVRREQALDHVAGYMLHNDYSEREHQIERSGQWVKGKSADRFAPMGPFFATADEINPSDVKLWLEVNGERRQESSTSDMIFDVASVVASISQYMTLLPGDVISTGTPAGVGMGRRPQMYLRPGDIVEYGADGLGRARQTVVDSPYAADAR